MLNYLGLEHRSVNRKAHLNRDGPFLLWRERRGSNAPEAHKLATFPPYGRDVRIKFSIYTFFFRFFIWFSRFKALDLLGCSSENTKLQGFLAFV